MTLPWRTRDTAGRLGIRLNLHPLNFFVGRHQLVPDLHHQLKRGIGLLQGHHRLVNVGVLAGDQRVDSLTGSRLRIVDVPDRLLQRIDEIRSPACPASLISGMSIG